MAELQLRVGTQFDPSIVAALERGLARQKWTPTQLEPGLMATAGRAFDHDDPAASDLMAGLAPPEPVGHAPHDMAPVSSRDNAP